MKRILLVGQNGQVSTYLQRRLSASFDTIVADRTMIDFANPASIMPALRSAKADMVINPAAYTAVDDAENNEQMAYLINRDAPSMLANCCAELAIPLVHFSTDYVFDGTATSPYLEDDLPNPTGVYGASKLAGERAILSTDVQAVILRTSWVYSNQGKNFYKTMLALAENRNELSVVADQIGSPTYAGSIAEACSVLVERLLEEPDVIAECAGVYHLSCEGETSWHGFASAIFELIGRNDLTINPVSTSAYPTLARRPAYSVLDGAKLSNVFGVTLPSWREGLRACVEENQRD